MNKRKAKGDRGEYQLRDLLKKTTGVQFERTPSSGALGPHLKLKGDLFIPNATNRFTIEVKTYKEDQFCSKTLVNKSNEFRKWWEQALRQAEQNGNKPLLCYKYNRGPWFVAVLAAEAGDCENLNYLYMSEFDIIITTLEDWLSETQPEFTQ